jgi:hypothetical protein
MTEEPDETPTETPTTHGPVPSDRAVRVLSIAVVLLIIAGIGLFGLRLYVLNENVREQDKTNAAQDQALAEANRRLEDAGQPQVPVPDPGTEVPVLTAAMLEAALEAYCGDCLGPPGRDGLDGLDGVGKRGPRGFTGEDSVVPGPPGGNGKDGKDGATGDRGLSCVEALSLDECRGADGADGKDGADGAPGVVAVVDACSPPAGEVVTDTGISYDQATQTITLTCTSAPQILKGAR